MMALASQQGDARAKDHKMFENFELKVNHHPAAIVAKQGTQIDEKVAAFVESCWEFLNTPNPDGSNRLSDLLSLDFPDLKTLGAFQRQAVAYAETRVTADGTPDPLKLRRSGVRNAPDTRFYFRMESMESYNTRMELNKQAKEEIERKKAAGIEVKPGRKKTVTAPKSGK